MRHVRSTILGFPPSIPQTRVPRRAPEGRASPRARTRRLRPWLARVLLVTIVATLLLATSGERAPAQAEPLVVRDWMHALYAVADLQTRPPQTPVVVLLGGSAGRESTISDGSWREQIAAGGGPPVLTRNLCSMNQSFAQDLHLVRALPPGPTLVFIGINLYRFCVSPTIEFVTDTGPFVRGSLHRYDTGRTVSEEDKQQIAATWIARFYPKFDDRFPGNVAVLDELVKTCLARGQRPVLLDLPRNVAVIGDRLDVPFARYTQACLGIAARYDIPYIGFVTDAGLESGDFRDLAHLLEAGRAKWQRLLSDTSVSLLQAYGMDIRVGKPATARDDVGDWVVSPWTSLPVFLLPADPSQD